MEASDSLAEAKLKKIETMMESLVEMAETQSNELEEMPNHRGAQVDPNAERPRRVQQNIASFGTILDRIGSQIHSTFSSLSSGLLSSASIQRAQARIMELLQKTARALYRAVGAVSDCAKFLLDCLTSAISGLMKWIGVIFKGLCAAVKAIVKPIWDGFMWFLEKTYNISVAVLKKIGEWIAAGVQVVAENGRTIAIAAGTAVASAGATYGLATAIMSAGLIVNPVGAAVAAGLFVTSGFTLLASFL